MKLFFPAVVALAATGHPATAQSIFDQCLALLESGEVEKAIPLAKTIKNMSGITSENVSEATECVSKAFQTEYVYNTAERKFITQKSAAAQDREFQQKIDSQKALEEQERRKEAAFALTLATCNKLFRQDPEEAILHSVCNRIFLQHGLPK